MAKNIHIGVYSLSRKAKSLYMGGGNIAKKIKSIYTGVNGVARSVYTSINGGRIILYQVNSTTTPYTFIQSSGNPLPTNFTDFTQPMNTYYMHMIYNKTRKCFILAQTNGRSGCYMLPDGSNTWTYYTPSSTVSYNMNSRLGYNISNTNISYGMFGNEPGFSGLIKEVITDSSKATYTFVYNRYGSTNIINLNNKYMWLYNTQAAYLYFNYTSNDPVDNAPTSVLLESNISSCNSARSWIYSNYDPMIHYYNGYYYAGITTYRSYSGQTYLFRLYYSSDLTNWYTKYTLANDYSWKNILMFKDDYIYIYPESIASPFTSKGLWRAKITDSSLTWTRVAAESVFNSPAPGSVIMGHNGAYFILSSANQQSAGATSKIYYSKDAISWTLANTISKGPIYGICCKTE